MSALTVSSISYHGCTLRQAIVRPSFNVILPFLLLSTSKSPSIDLPSGVVPIKMP